MTMLPPCLLLSATETRCQKDPAQKIVTYLCHPVKIETERFYTNHSEEWVCPYSVTSGNDTLQDIFSWKSCTNVSASAAEGDEFQLLDLFLNKSDRHFGRRCASPSTPSLSSFETETSAEASFDRSFPEPVESIQQFLKEKHFVWKHT